MEETALRDDGMGSQAHPIAVEGRRRRVSRAMASPASPTQDRPATPSFSQIFSSQICSSFLFGFSQICPFCRPSTMQFIFMELRAEQSPATASRHRLRHTTTISGHSPDHLRVLSSVRLPTIVLTNVNINTTVTAPDTASSDQYDEWDESTSGSGINQPHEAHSHTQRQDEISPRFMELVHSVEALKISHRAKTLHTRQMHKALAKIVVRMDMDAAFLELFYMKISGPQPAKVADGYLVLGCPGGAIQK
ncbi:hypothetical protein ACLOJK_037618 [Asimina triloba]